MAVKTKKLTSSEKRVLELEARKEGIKRVKRENKAAKEAAVRASLLWEAVLMKPKIDGHIIADGRGEHSRDRCKSCGAHLEIVYLAKRSETGAELLLCGICGASMILARKYQRRETTSKQGIQEIEQLDAALEVIREALHKEAPWPGENEE